VPAVRSILEHTANDYNLCKKCTGSEKSNVQKMHITSSKPAEKDIMIKVILNILGRT